MKAGDKYDLDDEEEEKTIIEKVSTGDADQRQSQDENHGGNERRNKKSNKYGKKADVWSLGKKNRTHTISLKRIYIYIYIIHKYVSSLFLRFLGNY
jgi:hypothetical protein